ncbi:MAG: SET domain-containing protein [Gemmatimonadota bacterium]|nr:SET domain-containing protein [Gemmatimonadota bacterium]
MSVARMLRIPTYVAPSSIAGVGVFSATHLPAGTVIWEFTEGVDRRITADEFERFPEAFRDWIRHYLYRDDSGLFVFCGDNAKYMNHEDDPNCDDSGPSYTITRRPIRSGEELTCDYTLFDEDTKVSGLRFGSSVGSAA